MPDEVVSGIMVGMLGGAAAGSVLWLVERLNQYEISWREKRKILLWLDSETPSDTLWRSTRAIASYTDLTEDRVRYLCSVHPKIVQSTGQNEMWGIKGRARE